jgi:hypothetical protein
VTGTFFSSLSVAARGKRRTWRNLGAGDTQKKAAMFRDPLEIPLLNVPVLLVP